MKQPTRKPLSLAGLEVTLWTRLLLAPLPWVSKGLQHLALIRLCKLAQAGDLHAAGALSLALDLPQTTGLRTEIQKKLSTELPPIVTDHLWEDWSKTRRPALGDFLVKRDVAARPQSTAWTLSQASLNHLGILKGAVPARIAPLIALLNDPAPNISVSARSALTALSIQESRDELIRLWAEGHSPILWQIIITAGYIPSISSNLLALYYLKAADIEPLLHAPPALVSGLVSALSDPDPEIAVFAQRCLTMLQDEAAMNTLAEIWRQSRSHRLKDILVKGKLIATQPYELRLLTALLVYPELAAQAAPQGIPTLVQASENPDGQIATAARTALLNLSQPQTRSELCLFAVQQNNPTAFNLALQASYRPEFPQQRALFVFLAGLWEEYGQLDFDHRFLQVIFSTSPLELRQRIALQVQRSGRTDFLDILSGPDFSSSAGKLTAEETGLYVQMLLTNQVWAQLWLNLHFFPLAWSIRALQALQSAGWKPETTAECTELKKYIQLAAGLEIPALKTLIQSLPPAVNSAEVEVQGRINDVCFTPSAPLIVIGTGSRKVALWNFQQGKLIQVRQGFNHSISRVACAGSDYVLCGVRSNSDAACLIYGWQQEEPFVLPGHLGAVTALLPVDETTLLSTGRDGAVILWNLATRSEITRQSVPDWPRSASLLPDHQTVALLNSSITLLRLPNLAEKAMPPFWTRANSNTHRSMTQCSLWPPDDPGFLIGQRNGQVVHYSPSRNGQKIMREALLWQTAPIIQLAYLTKHQLLVTAVQNGQILFHHWPDLSPVKTVTAPQGQLTSLQISADEALMATGTSDSSMLLWDLRSLDFPDLIDLPLSQATPDHLTAVNSLLRSSNPSTPVERLLELLKALLMRRFLYDIQVDELPQIQPGEFDILLD